MCRILQVAASGFYAWIHKPLCDRAIEDERLLKLIRESSDIERLARQVDDNGGVFLVPAFAGLGAPHWDPYARGVLVGLSRGSSDAHVARAALEAAHAEASLASLGSFLRTALEGLPRVGVGGAFDVARKNRCVYFFYFRAHAQLPGALTSRLFVRRGSDRAALATSLYGSSAFEYAAGFFLSWTVPGPLAAHAAHFTNR